MTDFTKYFAPGVKNTLFLKNGVNFYNRGPWIQIYDNTELDRWYVGDFAAANYIISVEFDSQKKETMSILVVARPDQASYSIYGRASIDDPLVTISATVNDSYLSLRLSPIIPEYEGVRVIYSAQYYATLTDLQRPSDLTFLVDDDDISSGGGGGTIPGGGSTGGVDNTNLSAIDRTLTPTTTDQFDIGIALRRFNNLFLSGLIDIDGVLISKNSDDGIELPESSTVGGNSLTSFSRIVVSGSPDIESSSIGSNLRFIAGSGIDISSDAETNSVTFSSTGGGASSGGAVSANAFGAVAVSGQSTVRADAPSDTLTLVAGTGIQITTNATSDRITITNTGSTGGSGGSSGAATEVIVQEVVEGVYPIVLAEGTDTLQGQSLYAQSSVTLDAATNTLNVIATTAKWADLAENYQADKTYEPGTVLEFGGDCEVTVAAVETIKVAGVVSTKPAHLMNSELKGDSVVALALIGRIPCKVVGKINKGDMLVSAGGGYAKAMLEPTLGSVIGKSLEDFDNDTGIIEIVVGRL